MFETRNNTTTLSVYVQDVTVDCYDKATRTVEEKTFQLYAEKVPSVSVIESELKKAGFTPVGDITVKLNTELSGLYEMDWDVFVKYGMRVGDVRPKKEKTPADKGKADK